MKSLANTPGASGAPANLVELLCERAARHPQRVALTFLGDGENVSQVLTYGELDAVVRRLAAHLQALAPAGERALLLYPSGPEYVVAFLACLYAGIIAVPAYPPESQQPHHVRRLMAIAHDAAPRLVLTEGALAGAIAQVTKASPLLASCQVVATDRLEGSAARGWRMPALDASSVAFLQYTSGSTAAPKGVIVGHDNLMANERVVQEAFGMNDEDVVLSWLPLFHDMGLIGTLLQPLYAGISAVLMAPQHFMARPARWLEAMSRHRATVSGAPDFAYRLCAERVPAEARAALDLSRWRLAFSGAEPVRAATMRAFADRFAASRFDAAALYACYGLAESTLLVTGGKPRSGLTVQRFEAQALSEQRAVTSADGRALVGCGHAWPAHAIIIADPESGAALGAGAMGEILVSGPSVAAGYFRNAAATADAFVWRGEQRFLRTGDLGFFCDGELFIAGRHSDRIIIRGHNLYPQDIEQTVEEHVEVVRKGRTVAFGVDVDGEEWIVIAAEVSPRFQKLLNVDAVTRSIGEVVARAHGQAPRAVVLLNPGAVPITSSGKLQRGACREAWRAGKLPSFVAPSASEAAGRVSTL